jgi:uncharacterized protein YbjT (DUF2867 family)
LGIAAVFPAKAAASQSGGSDEVAAGSTVLVAGATGRTGREVVDELLTRGYKVRAFVRDAAAARKMLGEGIEYAVGDVRQRESIDAALHGVTAIICSIGASPSRDDPANGPEFVDYGGVKNLADAAVLAGLRHFVLVSSAGVTRENAGINQSFSNILMWKLRGEEAVRSTSVPYTIVRPGGLTDNPGGQQALQLVQGDSRRGRVARADVARVVVAALAVPDARNKTFELFSEEGTANRDLTGKFSELRED